MADSRFSSSGEAGGGESRPREGGHQAIIESIFFRKAHENGIIWTKRNACEP